MRAASRAVTDALKLGSERSGKPVKPRWIVLICIGLALLGVAGGSCLHSGKDRKERPQSFRVMVPAVRPEPAARARINEAAGAEVKPTSTNSRPTSQ
jgi:hypothetical protein